MLNTYFINPYFLFKVYKKTTYGKIWLLQFSSGGLGRCRSLFYYRTPAPHWGKDIWVAGRYCFPAELRGVRRLPSSYLPKCIPSQGGLCPWCRIAKGWREPGNMTLQRSRIFRMVLLKMRITAKGMGPHWQRQSEERAERDSLYCLHWPGPGPGTCLKWVKFHLWQLKKLSISFYI